MFWWGDERFVEPASPDRNERQARESFLDQVDVDPAHVHPMPSTESASSAEEGAAAYGEELRAHGSGLFEVVMLGVGPDAHVASLFPGYPQLDVDDIALAVHDSPKPPPDRITLTLPCLNRSKAVWFIVSGEDKADAVALALAEGTDLHDAPAAGVSGQDETIWFLDRAAASKLCEPSPQPETHGERGSERPGCGRARELRVGVALDGREAARERVRRACGRAAGIRR